LLDARFVPWDASHRATPLPAEEAKAQKSEEIGTLQQRLSVADKDVVQLKAERGEWQAKLSEATKTAELLEAKHREAVRQTESEKVNCAEQAKRNADSEAANTKRVKDLEAAHAKRVSDLEAEHAKRVKDLETENANRVNELEGKLQATSTKLAASEKQAEAEKAKSTDLAKRIQFLESQAQAATAESTKQIEELQSKLAKSTAEAQDFQSNLQETTKNLQECVRQRDDLTVSLQASRNEVEACHAQLRMRVSELGQREEELHEMTLRAGNFEQKGIDVQVQLEQTLANHEKQTADLHSRLNQSIAIYEKQAADLQSRLDQSENQTADLQKRLEQTVASYENQCVGLQGRLEQFEKKSVELQSQLNETVTSNEKQTADLQMQREKQAADLQTRLDQSVAIYEKQSADLQARLDQSELELRDSRANEGNNERKIHVLQTRLEQSDIETRNLRDGCAIYWHMDSSAAQEPRSLERSLQVVEGALNLSKNHEPALRQYSLAIEGAADALSYILVEAIGRPAPEVTSTITYAAPVSLSPRDEMFCAGHPDTSPERAVITPVSAAAAPSLSARLNGQPDVSQEHVVVTPVAAAGTVRLNGSSSSGSLGGTRPARPQSAGTSGRPQDVGETLEWVRTRLEERHGDLMQAFYVFDSNKTGRLTCSEITACLQGMGLSNSVAGHVVRELTSLAQCHNRSYITMQEWLAAFAQSRVQDLAQPDVCLK